MNKVYVAHVMLSYPQSGQNDQSYSTINIEIYTNKEEANKGLKDLVIKAIDDAEGLEFWDISSDKPDQRYKYLSLKSIDELKQILVRIILEYPEEADISSLDVSDFIDARIEEKIIKGKILKPINLLSGKT